ncbi:hypothetical protein Avbf_11045, partial [Armadillidium vulgare]
DHLKVAPQYTAYDAERKNWEVCSAKMEPGVRFLIPYTNRCYYRSSRPISFPLPRPIPLPLLQATNSSVQEPEESESPSEPKPQLNSQEKPKSPLTQESHSSSTQKPQP